MRVGLAEMICGGPGRGHKHDGLRKVLVLGEGRVGGGEEEQPATEEGERELEKMGGHITHGRVFG